MATLEHFAAIRRCLSNSIEATAIGDRALAGIIGDAPSHYSKSPILWNAAFVHLGMNAAYFPFDVADAKLADLLDLLKSSGRFLGANVTVPHKVRVMDFLDEVDPGAARIKAVNTIVPAANGKLIGYNTDGEGFVESILKLQPGRDRPFLASLKGINVLLLGAGGSARAVAYHVGALLDGGKLWICNRTPEPAVALAAEMQRAGYHAAAVPEAELNRWAPQSDLIVNSTTKGQGGIRRLANGAATMLEAYSALAPAQPPSFPEAAFAKPDFHRQWSAAAQSGIDANLRASMELAKSIPALTAFYDLVYHPEETPFLQHGRMSGHATMNGKAMIVNQAVVALCRRVCRAELQARGMDSAAVERRVLNVMYAAW